MIRRPSASSKLSGGNGSIRFIPLAQPQAGGPPGIRLRVLAELGLLRRLDSGKVAVFRRRLVGAEYWMMPSVAALSSGPKRRVLGAAKSGCAAQCASCAALTKKQPECGLSTR